MEATGVSADARRISQRLIGQLCTKARGLADSVGSGLQADDDGPLRHADQHRPHLFAIDNLLSGVARESGDMPKIRRQARVITARLLGART